MSWNRQTRGLSQRKQEKPQIKKHRPLDSEGSDGDFSIRQLDDGVFLFFKALGKWYKTLNAQSQIIPEAPNARSLGAPDRPMRKMYVSSKSIHIGDTKSEQGALRLEKDSTSNIDYLTFKKYGATKSTTLVEEEEVSGSRYIDLGGLSGSSKSPIFALPSGAATGMFKYGGGVHTILSFDTNNAQVNIPKGVLKFTEATAPSGGGIPGDGAGILFLDTSDDKLKYQHASLNSGNAIDLTLVTTLSNYLPLAGGTMTGGLLLNVASNHISLLSNADNADKFTMSTGANGETTLTTIDDSGTAGHLNFTVDGNTVFNNKSNFKIKSTQGGTPTNFQVSEDMAVNSNLPFQIDAPNGSYDYPKNDGVLLDTDNTTINDATTSTSGTYAQFYAYKLSKATLTATNASVTTTDAATLYLEGATVASTNQTITNNYALQLGGGNIKLPDDSKIIFGDADEYIKGDGTDLIISSTSLIDFNDSRLTNIARLGFNDGGTVDIVRDEDDMASDDNAALATQQSIKAYVDTNRRWHQHTGGYKLNNSSSTTYYFQYRFGDHNWSNSDSSPTTISVYDSYASVFIAPYAGTLDKISVHGYAADTGATDPFKFYVFKGTTAGGATNLSLTQIGVTAEVTPADTRQFAVHTSISSSNTFARNDSLFVMYKKESSSASQDLYFSVTISGVYTE